MIFLSKARDENAETAHLRSQAMKYALGLWGIYYFVKLILSLLDGDIQAADNSTAIVYIGDQVICQEFLLQKNRMEKIFHQQEIKTKNIFVTRLNLFTGMVSNLRLFEKSV